MRKIILLFITTFLFISLSFTQEVEQIEQKIDTIIVNQYTKPHKNVKRLYVRNNKVSGQKITRTTRQIYNSQKRETYRPNYIRPQTKTKPMYNSSRQYYSRSVNNTKSNIPRSNQKDKIKKGS